MSRRGNNGFAMVLVLWVVALLMVIIPVFVYSMRSESASVANTADATNAHALAVAGIEMAIDEINGEFSIVSDGPAGIVFIERTGEGLRPIQSDRKMELGGGTIVYTIEDEKGKININTAGREVLDTLLRLTGIEAAERDVITDSIMDWRDENHEFHLNGAEDDYYSSLPNPYGAKDGPADFREELLLVKGVTPAAFYGKGSAMVPAKEKNSYAGIRKHVTVHGEGRLNLNTATREALEAYYGKGVASEIMLRRESEGYLVVPSNNGQVTSDTFLIESTGEYRGMKYGIEATVLKKPGDNSIVFLSWRDWGAVK